MPDGGARQFDQASVVEVGNGLVRTARRSWRCTCADSIRWFEVRGTYDRGTSTASTFRRTRREAEAVEQLMRERPPDLRTMKPYQRVEIIEHANPDYSPDCLRDIAVGARYFEYLGETAAYQSGSRYCAGCAERAWGIQISPPPLQHS